MKDINPSIVVPVHVPLVMEEIAHYTIRDRATKATIETGEVSGNTWLQNGKNAIAVLCGTEASTDYFNRVYVKVGGTPDFTPSQNHSRNANVLSIDSDWFTTTGNYGSVLGSKDAIYYNSIATNITLSSGQEIKFTLEYTFTGPAAVAGFTCASRMGNINDVHDHAIGTIEVTGTNYRDSVNSTTSNNLECKNTSGFTFGSPTDVVLVAFKTNVEGQYFVQYNSGFTIPVDTDETFYVKATFTFG